MGSEEDEAARSRPPFQEGKRQEGPKLERDLGRRRVFVKHGHFQAYAAVEKTLQ